ncbi:kynurenine formamidase [Homoserinimonas aerilata]|uniref:Kynurenine formamidase n=1 Tax=Homoserinimonas aerilata TaxID=1162970 RepID=A0A542YAF6_9MICO|nr:cyclase family protein [Homoserinimonas aerilata]TQL45023.1 kynurenine formamidase [Homoserinimonas aerilata]
MKSWLSAFDSPTRTIDLAHPLSRDVPTSPSHVGFQMALKRRHGDSFRADGGSGASEVIITSPHTGTHIDALSHASHEGLLHGGVDAYEAQRGPNGFTALGAETIPPLVCRGVLIDLPKSMGVPVLEPGYEVTPDDLVAATQGVELEGAGVVLVRTGWAAHWGDAATYIGAERGVPGIGVAAAEWIAAHGPLAVGADTMAVEHIPAGQGHGNLPVHSLLLVGRGIYIIENLDLEQLSADGSAEFLFVLAPLPIVGGTGSPVRPLAIVRHDD